MKCRTKVIALLSGTMLLTAGTAHALSLGTLGTNITVNDGVNDTVSSAGDVSWYGGSDNTSFAREDNEVEPGAPGSSRNALGPEWDLEGFFLSGTDLSIVSGFNLYEGKKLDGVQINAGDIFIDLNGDAVYGPNSPNKGPAQDGTFRVSNSHYNYDYVLDINWSAGTYNIVQLSPTSKLRTGVFGNTSNWESNPWRYATSTNTGVVINALPISFNTYGKTSQTGTGFLGDNHYVATFSGLDFLSEATANVVFHTTMACGNDNLIGIAAVPEPSTMLLLGSGLLGFALLNRRKNKSC